MSRWRAKQMPKDWMIRVPQSGSLTQFSWQWLLQLLSANIQDIEKEQVKSGWEHYLPTPRSWGQFCWVQCFTSSQVRGILSFGCYLVDHSLHHWVLSLFPWPYGKCSNWKETINNCHVLSACCVAFFPHHIMRCRHSYSLIMDGGNWGTKSNSR